MRWVLAWAYWLMDDFSEQSPEDVTGEWLGLVGLAARVERDLALTAHPNANWLTPRIGADGKPALDVLVVGGGQSGLATSFGLMRAKVDNILVIDRAPFGFEGPWRTYARMATLRSPKDFTGPDLDVPSLTFQAWYEAQFGEMAWQSLDLISREDWAAYLLWVRQMTAVPVRNGVELIDITPVDGLLAARLRTEDGEETVFTRKILLATGQDGVGRWWLPPMFEALPPERRAHAADDIDFTRLQGRTVAVIGAGASAFDNAAVALEHGAEKVMLLCRRAQPQVIQPYRWLTFKGFLNHLSDLDDVWRWRFMAHILGLREGFPQATFDRCAKFDQFHLMTGAEIDSVAMRDEHVLLSTAKGPVEADFVIAGTGIDMDFAARPELTHCADNIATWSDHYTPPIDERNDRLGRFPYLSPDYAFVEKTPGQTPWIEDIHLFSIASTMSFGPSGSSINAMTSAVPKLVSSITKGLFQNDVEHHWQRLLAYDVPQAIVPGS